ncbi:MAG: class I SAM-dependent methyltransferase [Acidobacteria bacterium]|nr:class I SAM-dependent methyltransferase [Acidobacteriota bacterium]
MGYHILPIHYYSPIPDTRQLPEEIFERESELPGLEMNEKMQIHFLKDIFPKYAHEYIFPDDSYNKYAFNFKHASIVSFDAEVLHSFIREFKPKRIFEIGSGSTTLLITQAVSLNENNGITIAHDPYPVQLQEPGKIPGLTKLDKRKAETIEPGYFSRLEENDILFIDSTHALKIGGDVRHLYLEVIPRLKKGVLIHFHDILFPKEYFKDWVLTNRYFWNEMYLVQAFLAFNNAFEVLWCSSYMHCKYDRGELVKVFPHYNPGIHFPGSLWIRKIK